MVKKKSDEKTEDKINVPEWEIKITGAIIVDGLLNYTYEVVKGIGMGFTHSVKGKGIVEESLRFAFAKLNVHMAAIDDIFKHADIKVGNIKLMNGDELTLLFLVDGFKIKGTNESESVILIGNKTVTLGRQSIDTPKVAMDNLSGYEFGEQLKEAVDECRKEVMLYHEGNCTYPEVKAEEKPTPTLFNPDEGKSDEQIAKEKEAFDNKLEDSKI